MVEFSKLLWCFIDIVENKRKFRADPDLKLMDQVWQVLRYHHYAYRTEKASARYGQDRNWRLPEPPCYRAEGLRLHPTLGIKCHHFPIPARPWSTDWSTDWAHKSKASTPAAGGHDQWIQGSGLHSWQILIVFQECRGDPFVLRLCFDMSWIMKTSPVRWALMASGLTWPCIWSESFAINPWRGTVLFAGKLWQRWWSMQCDWETDKGGQQTATPYRTNQGNGQLKFYSKKDLTPF